MRDRMVRYANNNDVVPLIPPQIIPWVPTRVYGHMGEFRYFNDGGFCGDSSWLGQRFPDRLLGLRSPPPWKSGPDAIDDHKMEFYLANLEKALAKEEEEAKLEIERSMLAGDFVEDMKATADGKKRRHPRELMNQSHLPGPHRPQMPWGRPAVKPVVVYPK
jgi:hypothetical protein